MDGSLRAGVSQRQWTSPFRRVIETAHGPQTCGLEVDPPCVGRGSQLPVGTVVSISSLRCVGLLYRYARSLSLSFITKLSFPSCKWVQLQRSVVDAFTLNHNQTEALKAVGDSMEDDLAMKWWQIWDWRSSVFYSNEVERGPWEIQTRNLGQTMLIVNAVHESRANYAGTNCYCRVEWIADHCWICEIVSR